MKERDEFLIVGTVPADEAEIGKIACLVDGDTLQTVGDREIFLVGKWFRVIDPKLDAAVCNARVALEQLVYMRSVNAVACNGFAQCFG